MKKILITGANGFIGSRIIEKLINQKDYEIHVLVRKTSNLEKLENFKPKIKFFYGDVREIKTLIEPVKSVDIIIHCAAVLRCIRNDTYYEVNYIGTKNLIETIISHNPDLKGFIYVSSQAATGPAKYFNYKTTSEECLPVSHYGKSKFLAEKEVWRLSNSTKRVILRPAAVYGPYDKDMYIYFKLAEKGILPIFNKNFYIQFIYIYDLVEIISKIVLDIENITSGTYFIAEENFYNIKELRQIFSEVVGKKVCVIYVPYLIAYIAAYINEKIYKFFYKKPAIFNRDKLKELKQNFWLCKSDDIKNVFKDFNYTKLKDGIKYTYNWYKQTGWL